MSKNTIKLKHPIKDDGETISELTLPRPKVKHLKAMDMGEGEVEKASLLIASLSGVSIHVIEQLDAEDFAAVSNEVAGFFGGNLPTGGS